MRQTISTPPALLIVAFLLLSAVAAPFPAFAQSQSQFTVTGDAWFDLTGNFGVGTTSPAAKLHVNGEAILGNTGLSCAAGTEGALRWNSTSHTVEICNGAQWVPLGGGPAAFSFTNQTGVNLSTTIQSNAVALSGFSGILPAVCNSGCTGIARNGVWSGISTNVASGDTIAIEQLSSSSTSTATTASVTVGSTTSSTWSVTTTSSPTTTPDAFSFIDQTNLPASTLVTSNTVSLRHFTGTVTATCNGGCSAIAKNGVWGGTSVAGFADGNTIAIQQTTSANTSTATTASVTAGTTTSSTWTATTSSSTDPCDGSPSPGTVCNDGTVYAGLSPDGNVKMYVTRCDAGMSWNGSACTGTRLTYTWCTANGGTGYISTTTGKANSDGLVALGTTPAPAPCNAARQCGVSTSNGGHSDWYLPAKDEFNVIYTNNVAIGPYFAGNYYWNSTEATSTTAWVQHIPAGTQASNQNKTTTYYVRCARK